MVPNDRWFAVQVKGRVESNVARALEDKGYDCFAPHYEPRRHLATSRPRPRHALFPGYVFCRPTSASTGRIVSTPGVIRIVGIGNVPVPIDDAEMYALQQLVGSPALVEPDPFLRLGEKVRIVAGPLAGIEGTLIRVANQHRLVVSVSMLQRSVSAEIHSAFAVPISHGIISE